MRKVRFTESQMKSILGEDFNTYLDKESEASEVPGNSYGTEVFTQAKMSDGSMSEPPTQDRVDLMNPRMSFRRRGVCEDKKKVNEENHELMNHSYNLGMQINQNIDNMASINPNDKLLQNMANDKDMKHGTAKKRKHDLEQMSQNNPERFQQIGGEQLLRGINQKLKADTSASRNFKQAKKDQGIENAFLSKHTKQSGNGKAHGNKTSNGSTVRYEN